MFMDRDVPLEAKGKRPPTPGETAALKDFDARRRAYRDPDTGEDFRDLRNRGEFSATYDVLPGRDGKTAAAREFRFEMGNTAHMEPPGALPPHLRIHSHPDFTLPVPSPQDHRVAARNYAAHGEKNYLVTAQNKVFQFGPGKDGPEFTQLSPIDVKTPTEPSPGGHGSPLSASSADSDAYWRDFRPGQPPPTGAGA